MDIRETIMNVQQSMMEKKISLSDFKDLDKVIVYVKTLQSELDKAKEEIESLKCCGNCERSFGEHIKGTELYCNSSCKRSPITDGKRTDDFWIYL